MRLQSLTEPELIFPSLPGSDREAILHSLAESVSQKVLSNDAEKLYSKLWEREQIGSTGIGSGVAIPHCKMKGLDRAVLAIGVVEPGVDFGAVDNQPVKLFFLVVSPAESPAEHLQILAAISRWVKSDNHVEKILNHPDRQTIYNLLAEDSS